MVLEHLVLPWPDITQIRTGTGPLSFAGAGCAA